MLLNIPVDLQHNQIMRLYARALKAKHRPKYSLGIICQWIGGLVNSPLLARSAYGSSVLCSRDESDTASRTKPFIGNSLEVFFGALLRFRYHLYRSNAPHRGGDFMVLQTNSEEKKVKKLSANTAGSFCFLQESTASQICTAKKPLARLFLTA